MGLSKKTFLYSIILASIMVALVVGYFVAMLPSLYVDYVMKENLDSVVEIQKAYMAEKSFDSVAVRNPTSVYTLEVPNQGSFLYVTGTFFQMTIKVRDQELKELLDQVRAGLDLMDGGEEVQDALRREEGARLWEKLSEKLIAENLWKDTAPIAVQVEERGQQGAFAGEYEKIHWISEELMVYEGGISDENYGYITYVAMSRGRDGLVVTVMPTMTPRMDEITPVVMGSLPMIVAVVFLMILVSSRFFAKRIVDPVIRLAGYAKSASLAEHFEIAPFETNSRDEIGELSREISQLYEKLSDSYRRLEEKNQALKEENVRQEVFLRASAHQLKTPISAALLLVAGMTDQIGKYKDTQKYLPKVKEQLLSMKRTVEDILYLNYHVEQMEQEEVAVEQLAQELAAAYAPQIEEKQLTVVIRGRGSAVSDRELMKKILDNLFSNAVQYTPVGKQIEVTVSQRECRIKNSGAAIGEELLPNIFEPFVTSQASGSGKGLGLYVAAYYSRAAGYRLTLENQEDGVLARLWFAEKMREQKERE